MDLKKHEIAMAAGRDAGNRAMSRAGRKAGALIKLNTLFKMKKPKQIQALLEILKNLKKHGGFNCTNHANTQQPQTIYCKKFLQ